MARFAFGLNMFSAQHIFGVAIVIKRSDAPIFFRVTGGAFFAETALVSLNVVIGLVTSHASGLEFFLV